MRIWRTSALCAALLVVGLIATRSSRAATPNAGSFNGQQSNGQNFDLVVRSDSAAVTSFTYGFNDCGTGTSTTTGNIPISGSGSFSTSGGFCPSHNVSGTFNTATTASGSIILSWSGFPCACSGSVTRSWSATWVPPPPTVAFAAASSTVAEAGGSASVNVALTTPGGGSSAAQMTVNFSTANGTASSGSDYTTSSGTLTFPAGSPNGTARTVSVPILNDGADEADETFTASLSAPSGGVVGSPSVHTFTIADDDPEPSLSIADAAVTEGNGASVNAGFAVTLSAASGRTVTVTFATTDGSALAGSDYTAASGTLTIPAGTTIQTLNVAVTGDLMDEPDESFFVNLGTATGATVADGQALGTIFDNDPPPTVSVGDATVTEGNSGAVAASFTVSLSNPSSQTITVAFATADQTATAPADYTGASGTLTFAAGVTAQTAAVSVAGDLIDEDNETFVVNLSSPVNVAINDGQGVGTITDDDAAPTISVDDPFVTEGNVGTTPALFTARLSNPSSRQVTVAYATADASAMAPGDYLTASGTLTFAPLTTSQSVNVSVVGDVAIELDETFLLNLTSPVNATLGDAQGVATIADDDAPSLSSNELIHGAEQVRDLAALPGPTAKADLFRLAQKPRSSYEVMVEDVAGAVAPLVLERLGADNVTVVQTAPPLGTGTALSLRWENAAVGTVQNQHLRVRSTGCSTACGSGDTYRLVAYETTGAIPRFNNSGTQITVLVLQNPATYTIAGNAWFWSTAGSLVAVRPFSLAPRSALVLNTATVPGLSGVAGAMTVSHDGRYGDLAGKTVALEPATGFSFDSPMLARPE